MAGWLYLGLLSSCLGHASGLMREISSVPSRSLWAAWRNQRVMVNGKVDGSSGVPAELLSPCARKILEQPPNISEDKSIGTDDGSVMNKEIEWIFDEVDHVYVLCVECEKFAVPREIAHKTSVISGIKSDECLGFAAATKELATKELMERVATKGGKRGGSGINWDHVNKVTATHKIAAANAQDEKYKLFMILEEDMKVASDKHELMDQATIQQKLNEFQVFRLGAFPNSFYYRGGGECCNAQCIFTNRSSNMGTVAGPCLIWSTVGYVARQDACQAIVDGQGIIDRDIMGTLQPHGLVDPSLLYQHGGGDEFGNQRGLWTDYLYICGRENPTVCR